MSDSAAQPVEPEPEDDFDAAVDDILDLTEDQAAVDGKSTPELFEELYEILHGMAARRMVGQRPNHTLQATALIHNAFVKLAGKEREWSSRSHFLFAVAKTFRRILIDHERARRTDKRTRPELGPIEDEYVLDVDGDLRANSIDLDAQMKRLHDRGDTWACSFLLLRVYADASMREIADALDTPMRTTEHRWKALRAWLRDALSDA